ncbi:MAG: hypothetical protein IT175_07270 [Acidobacteria bacterium]|nr:hypothetical protein [Acidobacteriota bacterium]
MSQTGADTAAIQKVILRAAAAAVSGAPLQRFPNETAESVNDAFVQALGMISRSARLEAIVEASKPIAARLASMPIEGDSENAEGFRSDVQHLLAAIAALHAFDHREADHTITD